MTSYSGDLERIRSALDIVDVVGQYVTLKRAGSAWVGLCPFHQEKTPSFNVNPSRQIFKCFGCGAGGDLFKFVQLRDNVSFGEAVRMLADRAGVRLQRDPRGSSSGPDRATLARVNEWAVKWHRDCLRSEAGRPAREYLAGRGFTEETLRAFEIGYAPAGYEAIIGAARAQKIPVELLVAAGLMKRGESSGPYATFRDRVMFPIREAGGRVIGFGGRAMSPDDPAKYLNTPETPLFSKGRQVYGLNQAREAIGKIGRAVVVEGYTDCMMAHQCGVSETVATLGTSFTAEHARMLRRYAHETVLVFDSDAAGRAASQRAMEIALAERLTVRVATVPSGKDPCDYLLSEGGEAFSALLLSAPEALESKWREIEGDQHASGTPERLRAVEAFLGLVARSAVRGNIDAIRLGFLVNQLSKLLSLPAEEIYRQVSQVRRNERQRAETRDATGGIRTGLGVRDAVDAAGRESLEVLLNCPELADSARESLVVEEIAEPSLRRVAGEFFGMIDSGEPFALGAFLSRFEEPEWSTLILGLQEAGERRGNYDLTLRAALDRLRFEHERRQMESVREAALAGAPGRNPDGADYLAQVHASCQGHHHFAGRRRFGGLGAPSGEK